MTVITDQTLCLMPDEMFKRVHALADRCQQHPAVCNSFYDLWTTEELAADEVELVATNFLARVQRTPVRIALAFLHMTDIAARAETQTSGTWVKIAVEVGQVVLIL